MDTARIHLQTSLPGQGAPGPFSIADVDSQKIFAQSWICSVRSEKIVVTFEFDSAEDHTKFNQNIIVPIRTMLSNEIDIKKSRYGMLLLNKRN